MPVSGLPDCAGKTCPRAVDAVHFIPLLLKCYSKLLVLPKASPPFHSDNPASDFIKKKKTQTTQNDFYQFPALIPANICIVTSLAFLQVSPHTLLPPPKPSSVLYCAFLSNFQPLRIDSLFSFGYEQLSVFPTFAFLVFTNACLLNPVDVCSSYCSGRPCCV